MIIPLLFNQYIWSKITRVCFELQKDRFEQKRVIFTFVMVLLIRLNNLFCIFPVLGIMSVIMEQQFTCYVYSY